MLQRGVADKTVNHLEKSVNSKLEATVARQIQVQFQTAGKQALQVLIKWCGLHELLLRTYDYFNVNRIYIIVNLEIVTYTNDMNKLSFIAGCFKIQFGNISNSCL